MITRMITRMTRKTGFFHVLLLVFMLTYLAAAPPWARADIPRYINYQGKLTDADDNPISDDVSITVRIYDAASGGTALWEETQEVTATRGIFSILLGSTTALTGLDFDAPYWYSVEVESDGEMSPRQRLTAVAYAINADKLDGYDASDFLISGGDGELSLTGGANEDINLNPTGTGNVVITIDSTSGDFKVTDGTTNYLLVDSETGNVTIAKNLTVTGTIYGSLAAEDGDSTFTNITVTDVTDLRGNVYNSTGVLTVADPLTVSGATTLSSTLAVSGATTLSSTLAVSGATTLSGALDMNANIDLDYSGTSAALDVTQASTGPAAQFSGNRVLIGEDTANAYALSTGELYVQGDLEVDGVIYGNVNTSGSQTFGSTTMSSLVVTGTSDLQGNVYDSAGIYTIADNTAITPAALTSGGTDDYAVSIAQTLNDTGAAGGSDVYRGIKVNVTETDKTGWDNVYLMDLQVGDASKFAVDDSGNLTLGGTVDGVDIAALAISDASDYDSIGDLPTAAVVNGATTTIATGDQIYDFVTGLGYIADDTSVAKSDIADSGTLAFDWANDEVADALTISGGIIDNTVIGGTTAAAATFTQLTMNDGTATTGTLTYDSTAGYPFNFNNKVSVQDIEIRGSSPAVLSFGQNDNKTSLIYDPATDEIRFSRGTFSQQFRNLIKNASFEAFSAFEDFHGYDTTYATDATVWNQSLGYQGGWDNFAPDDWTYISGKVFQHSPLFFKADFTAASIDYTTYKQDTAEGRSAVRLEAVTGIPGKISQTISGLKPSTVYSVGVKMRVDAGGTAKIDIENEDGEVPSPAADNTINAFTKLTAELNPTATIVQAENVSNFPAYGIIQITTGATTERIRYEGLDEATGANKFLKCTRGSNATTHSINTKIIVAPFLAQTVTSTGATNYIKKEGQFSTDRKATNVNIVLSAVDGAAYFDTVQIVAGGTVPEYSPGSIVDTGDQTLYGTLRIGRSSDEKGGILAVDQVIRTRGIDFFENDPGISGATGGGGAIDQPWTVPNALNSTIWPKVYLKTSGNYVDPTIRKFQVQLLGNTIAAPTGYMRYRYRDCIDPMREWDDNYYSPSTWDACTWYTTNVSGTPLHIPTAIEGVVQEVGIQFGIKLSFDRAWDASNTAGFQGGDAYEFKAYGMSPEMMTYDAFNKDATYRPGSARIYKDPVTGELTFEDSKAGSVRLSEIISQSSAGYVSPPVRDSYNTGTMIITATGDLNAAEFLSEKNFEIGIEYNQTSKFWWNIRQDWATGTYTQWYGNWGQSFTQGTPVSLIATGPDGIQNTGDDVDTGIDITFPSGTYYSSERWTFYATPGSESNVAEHSHTTGPFAAAGTSQASWTVGTATNPLDTDVVLNFGQAAGEKYIKWDKAGNKFVVNGILTATSITGVAEDGHVHAGTDIVSGTVNAAYLPTAAVSTAGIIPSTGLIDGMVSATAAITGTKISPNFGAQNVVTTGNVGIGTTSPDALLHAEKPTNLTNAIQPVARLTHVTTGAPAAGIGLGVEFEQETSAGNNELIANIDAVTTNVGSGTEAADLVFRTMAAGAAAAERMRITSAGKLDVTGVIEAGSGNIAITDAAGNLDAAKVANADLGDISVSSGVWSVDVVNSHNHVIGDITEFTSLELAGQVSNETGSGALVFATSPTLTTPKFADLGYIADANGNELLILDTVTNAVNELTLANAAATGAPTLTASGSDTNISINLVPKGAGTLQVNGTNVSLATHNHTGVYEPVLTAGTTAQYYRGDKSWQTLDNTAVGLGSVDDVQQMPMSYLDDTTTLGTSDVLVPSQNAVKSYVDSMVAGLSWKEAVISIADHTLSPPAEAAGNRYLLTEGVATVHANWDGAEAGDMVQFNGTSWVEEDPQDGDAVFIENIDTGYVYTGSAWTPFTGASAYTWGNGLVNNTGAVIDVNVGNGIQIIADAVAVKESEIDHNSLLHFLPAEHVNWAAASAGTIHASNYVDNNTTYTGGTNITLNGTTFNVDDAFIKNNTADTMEGTLTIATATPSDLIIDNTTAGADADSGYITLRGNDYVEPTNTELDMSVFLDVTSTTDYKLSIMNDGKTAEIASLDESGNLQIDGSLIIGSTALNATAATSGASLVGVYDELANSNATNVQDVLDDLDAAIGVAGSQNLWATISAEDATSTTANSVTDTLTITGAGAVATTISGDTLTISYTESDVNAILKSPAAVQTIQPTVDAVPLTIKGKAGGSSNVLSIHDSTSPTTAERIYVDSAGHMRIAENTAVDETAPYPDSAATMYFGRNSIDNWETIGYDPTLLIEDTDPAKYGKFTFSAPLQIEASSPTGITFVEHDAQGDVVISRSLMYDSDKDEFSFTGGKLKQAFQNIVRNPSFETNQPVGWVGLMNNWGYTIDGSVFKFGAKSLVIVDGDANSNKGIKTSVNSYDPEWSRLKGKSITISFWAKAASAITTSIGFDATGNETDIDTNNEIVPEQVNAINLTTNPTTWQNFTATYDVPEAATKLNVILYGAQYSSDGSNAPNINVYFDGITLVEGKLSLDYGPSPIFDTGPQVIYGPLAIGANYNPYASGNYFEAPRLIFGQPDSYFGGGFASYTGGSGEIRFMKWDQNAAGIFTFNRSVWLRDDYTNTYGATLKIGSVSTSDINYALSQGDVYVRGRVEIDGMTGGAGMPGLSIGQTVAGSPTTMPTFAVTVNDAWIRGKVEADAGFYGDGSNLTGLAGAVALNSSGAIVNDSGLKVNLATTNPGLAITDNKLDVKLGALGGLDKGVLGLHIEYDTSTLDVNGSNQLTLATAYATGSTYDGRFVNDDGDIMTGKLTLTHTGTTDETQILDINSTGTMTAATNKTIVSISDNAPHATTGNIKGLEIAMAGTYYNGPDPTALSIDLSGVAGTAGTERGINITMGAATDSAINTNAKIIAGSATLGSVGIAGNTISGATKLDVTNGGTFTFRDDTGQTIMELDESTRTATIYNLTVSGTTTTVNTTTTDADHWSISPGQPGTTALDIVPNPGITLSGNLIRAKRAYSGGDVFVVDKDGNITTVGTVDSIDVSAHDIATTGVHGVGAGAIVGTTLSQTLTNKIIDGDDNTLQDIADSSLKTITTANKVSGSAVQLAASQGLVNSTGLKVDYDNSTIGITGGKLAVVASYADAVHSHLDADIADDLTITSTKAGSFAGLTTSGNFTGSATLMDIDKSYLNQTGVINDHAITRTITLDDGSTKTISGSVLTINAVDTQTSGTLTDNSTLLKLQTGANAGATGYFIYAIDSVGTEMFKVDKAGNLYIKGSQTFVGETTYDNTQTIDVNNSEALLVRQDGDPQGGDVFIVNTTNKVVGINKTPASTIELDVAGDADFSGTLDVGTDNAFSVGATGNLTLAADATVDGIDISDFATGASLDHTKLSNIGTTSHAGIDTHIAATGANVHGLGTISTQAADNVAITGGSITGVSQVSVTGGAVSVDAGQNINLEGTAGNSYMKYNTTAGRLEFYVDGAIVAYMKN